MNWAELSPGEWQHSPIQHTHTAKIYIVQRKFRKRKFHPRRGKANSMHDCLHSSIVIGLHNLIANKSQETQSEDWRENKNGKISHDRCWLCMAAAENRETTNKINETDSFEELKTNDIYTRVNDTHGSMSHVTWMTTFRLLISIRSYYFGDHCFIDWPISVYQLLLCICLRWADDGRLFDSMHTFTHLYCGLFTWRPNQNVHHWGRGKEWGKKKRKIETIIRNAFITHNLCDILIHKSLLPTKFLSPALFGGCQLPTRYNLLFLFCHLHEP